MLTDSGIETDVLFNVGRDLPSFAVFPLLDDEEGRAILDRYYRAHLAVAADHGTGYVLETPTWRSTPDWGAQLGYDQEALDDLDRRSVAFMVGLRDSAPTGIGPVLISGCLGPRGDGYVIGEVMTVEQAREYHGHQVGVFAAAGCDLVTVMTITYVAEAAGFALAARDRGVPAVVYFTVETDGRLPDGTPLADAIEQVDAVTDGSVAWFGLNCAHPEHIAPALADGSKSISRFGALRANASRMSHAELDAAEELDDGDPEELARSYRDLRAALPTVTVFGGCCGTDVRHVRAIATAIAG